jgi:hypothetical protein
VALTGRSAEASAVYRLLAIQLLAQAVRDARSKNRLISEDALQWLNSPEARHLALLLGARYFQWMLGPEPVTRKDLPVKKRDTYFKGAV